MVKYIGTLATYNRFNISLIVSDLLGNIISVETKTFNKPDIKPTTQVELERWFLFNENQIPQLSPLLCSADVNKGMNCYTLAWYLNREEMKGDIRVYRDSTTKPILDSIFSVVHYFM